MKTPLSPPVVPMRSISANFSMRSVFVPLLEGSFGAMCKTVFLTALVEMLEMAGCGAKALTHPIEVKTRQRKIPKDFIVAESSIVG